MKAFNERQAEEQDAERISAVVFDYAARISNEFDPEKLLLLNADLARDLVGADRCTIWLRDSSDGHLWTKVAHGLPEIRIPAGHGLAGACVAQNETIVVNDTSQDPRFDPETDRLSGYATRSILALPLRSASGDVLGALQVLNKPGGFHDRDVKLLGLAASFSASALIAQKLRQEAETARLHFREMEIARDVQNRLFPQRPPRIPGFDIAAWCRPANFVGGDYYDFLYRPDLDLWFTVGDVSGKGISAALLMASIQASLRTQLNGQPDSVADVISELNRGLCASFNQLWYSTLVCARLDLINSSLTYVNAGHVLPRLLKASGQIEDLDRGGCPVGLFDWMSYEQAEVHLEKGDVLACFSDGISEATNETGEIWDAREIDRIMLENRRGSAADVLKRIVQVTDDYTGSGEQLDDMTIMVLEVL